MLTTVKNSSRLISVNFNKKSIIAERKLVRRASKKGRTGLMKNFRFLKLRGGALKRQVNWSVTPSMKQSIFFSRHKSFLPPVSCRVFRRVVIKHTYLRNFTLLNQKARTSKRNTFILKILKFIFQVKKGGRFKQSRKVFLGRTARKLLVLGLPFRHQSVKLSFREFKKIKKKVHINKKTFLQKKFRRAFSKNPFQNLEKFSFYKLFGYIKPKHRKFRRKGLKKFRTSYRRRRKQVLNPYKKHIMLGGRKRSKKKPRNLVFKNKAWCVQIKKSDGRLIYRPLKLSDFLSSRSGWRTKITSFKKRIPKSGRPYLYIRYTLRSRNEYDSLVFKKRKMYGYYKRIYKYMGWKFKNYRSLFKKYSLSYYKYASFRNIESQFAWSALSSRIIQAKASNLSDLFRNSTRYAVVSNSLFLWQLVQKTFINEAFPSSFYSCRYAGRDIGMQFQNRPNLYNWNKKYRIVYNKNTMLNHRFKKPFGTFAVSPIIFKNSAIFSSFSARFGGLLSNRQYHFSR